MSGVGSGDVPSGSLVARRGLSGSGQERGPRPPGGAGHLATIVHPPGPSEGVTNV